MYKPFFLAVAIGAAFVWWSSGVLPDVVASHFAAGGVADGFMPRGRYVAFMVGLVLAVPPLVFVVAGLARRLPVRFINLPNKQFWLAPERRASTLASLARFGAWASYATLAMLCVAHWLVVQANLRHPPRLEQAPFVGVLALFFLALFIGMVVVLSRFFRVP